MRYALPGRKLVEDCAGGNPDKLLSIFSVILSKITRGFFISEVVVQLFCGLGFIGYSYMSSPRPKGGYENPNRNRSWRRPQA